MTKIKVGIVGSGSLTETIYLPILSTMPEFSVDVLCDRNLPVAAELAKKFNIANVTGDISFKKYNVDLAIIVIPNAFHFTVAKTLLEEGINVLVEKPSCTTTNDVNELMAIQEKTKLVAAVGHVRRFYKNNIFIKDAITSGMFGKPLSFSFEEGYYLSDYHPTDTFISKTKSGGGVVIDMGPHIIDLLVWWFGNAERIEYYDDATGGIEAEAYMNIAFSNNITGSGTFSRLRKLRNSIIIKFEKAVVEVATATNQVVKVEFSGEGHSYKLTGDLNEQKQTVRDAFRDQLLNIHNSIINNIKPKVSIADSAACVSFIERCYANKLDLTTVYESF